MFVLLDCLKKLNTMMSFAEKILSKFALFLKKSPIIFKLKKPQTKIWIIFLLYLFNSCIIYKTNLVKDKRLINTFCPKASIFFTHNSPLLFQPSMWTTNCAQETRKPLRRNWNACLTRLWSSSGLYTVGLLDKIMVLFRFIHSGVAWQDHGPLQVYTW